jgi:hypothetical protein
MAKDTPATTAANPASGKETPPLTLAKEHLVAYRDIHPQGHPQVGSEYRQAELELLGIIAHAVLSIADKEVP